MSRGGKRHRHVPPALTVEQVRQVKQMRSVGWPCAGLARKFGVCRMTITRVLHGRGAYRGIT